MTKVYIGKIVNTHGIKGELRIKDDLNDIQRKEIFKINSHLIILDTPYLIKSYRRHKDYDMVSFLGLTNINEVLFLKGKKVYKETGEISLDSDNILDSELVTYKVKTDGGEEGIIKTIEKTGVNYKIIRLVINNKEILVPYHKDFIINIDHNKKELVIRLP